MADVKQEYGGALYLLCNEENLAESCLHELAFLQKLFVENESYITLLESPNVKTEEKLSMLDEAFSQNIHSYVLYFLKILTENGYISMFGACCEEYLQRFNKDRNICIAKITSTAALEEEQKNRLLSKLEKKTGKKVVMQFDTNPSLLGGIRVEVDGCLWDGSVRNKIQSIRDGLKNTVI